jgi:hypothetical protein
MREFTALHDPLRMSARTIRAQHDCPGIERWPGSSGWDRRGVEN